jgi:hypothetical protein
MASARLFQLSELHPKSDVSWREVSLVLPSVLRSSKSPPGHSQCERYVHKEPHNYSNRIVLLSTRAFPFKHFVILHFDCKAEDFIIFLTQSEHLLIAALVSECLQNIAIKRLAFLLCIRGAPGSDSARRLAILTEKFRDYPHSLQADSRNSTMT